MNKQTDQKDEYTEMIVVVSVMNATNRRLYIQSAFLLGVNQTQ